MAQECVSLHRRPHPFRHATNQKRHPCRIQATPTAALAEEGRSLQERQRIAYPDMHVSRRGMLAAAAVFLGSSASEPASAAPDPSATAADFVDYENKQQGYRIQRPSAWNQTGMLSNASCLWRRKQLMHTCLHVIAVFGATGSPTQTSQS